MTKANIAEAEYPAETGTRYWHRKPQFTPTEDEREELRNLFAEWAAYKMIHAEKVAEFTRIKITGRELSIDDRMDIHFGSDGWRLCGLVVRGIFFASVFLASTAVLWDATALWR